MCEYGYRIFSFVTNSTWNIVTSPPSSPKSCCCCSADLLLHSYLPTPGAKPTRFPRPAFQYSPMNPFFCTNERATHL